VVEGWLIGEVGFFEMSLGNHRSDGYFCPSTLCKLGFVLSFLMLPFLLPLLTTTHRSEENDKEEAASGFCDLRKENYIGIWLVRQLAGLGMLYEVNFLFCAVCRIGFSDIL